MLHVKSDKSGSCDAVHMCIYFIFLTQNIRNRSLNKSFVHVLSELFGMVTPTVFKTSSIK